MLADEVGLLMNNPGQGRARSLKCGDGFAAFLFSGRGEKHPSRSAAGQEIQSGESRRTPRIVYGQSKWFAGLRTTSVISRKLIGFREKPEHVGPASFLGDELIESRGKQDARQGGTEFRECDGSSPSPSAAACACRSEQMNPFRGSDVQGLFAVRRQQDAEAAAVENLAQRLAKIAIVVRDEQ